MRFLKFVYKLIVVAALIIAFVLSLNLFGIEFLNPYIFMKYEYTKTYPNIRYFEDVFATQRWSCGYFQRKDWYFKK